MRILILLILLPNIAFGETLREQISLDGRANFITLPPNTKRAHFFGISKGNSTSRVKIEVVGPKGIRIKAKASYLKNGYRKNVKFKKLKYYKLSLKTREKLSREHKECVDISPGEAEIEEYHIDISNFPPKSHELCDFFGELELSLLANQLSETYGGNWGRGNVCAYLLHLYSQAGSPSLDEELPESFTARKSTKLRTYERFTLLNKNACSNRDKESYLFYLTLDLRGVKTDETSLIIRVNEFEHQYSKASSIKPESEGRYAPRPIVLMNWLGNNCGSKINVTKWRKGKPLKPKGLNLYSFLPYKNLVLSLATVDTVLKGGKGTFTLFNQTDAYGVCFKLQRRRQKVHGYPR